MYWSIVPSEFFDTRIHCDDDERSHAWLDDELL